MEREKEWASWTGEGGNAAGRFWAWIGGGGGDERWGLWVRGICYIYRLISQIYL